MTPETVAAWYATLDEDHRADVLRRLHLSDVPTCFVEQWRADLDQLNFAIETRERELATVTAISDRWRRACLAACRRLADAEVELQIAGAAIDTRELGTGCDYSPAKCTTHHGTRPPR